MNGMKAGLLMLAALALGGCAMGTTPPPTGVLGRTTDTTRFKPVAVRAEWKMDLSDATLNVARKQLKYPDTAKFDGPPRFDAFYDTHADMTQVEAWGNAMETGPYGQSAKQGYYALWELPGDLRKSSDTNLPPWRLADLEVFDTPFDQ